MSGFTYATLTTAISDRSGMEFPYNEMVREWNGSLVHVSEFEAKQPQLEPRRFTGDPEGLENARPARTEPATQNLLPSNPLSLTSGSRIVTVTEPNHGRSTSDRIVLRNVGGSPGGLPYTTLENALGFTITKINNDSYTFDCFSFATVTEKSGGDFVTAGPVTQQA